VVAVVVLAAAFGCGGGRTPGAGEARQPFPTLRGPYLGQKPPGAEPELFAPGIVSTGLDTRDVAITPDGRELYFGVTAAGATMILVAREVGGAWAEPAVASFCDRGLNIEPAVAPDGAKLMFLSTRAPAGLAEKPGWGHQNIWVVDRRGDGWGEPYDLGAPVNTEAGEFFPSITRDGTLYFTRDEAPRKSAIYRARRVDGRYAEPERLPAQVNCGESQFNAFVAPDESLVIVPVTGGPDSTGEVNYYVAFRNLDDTWSGPVNLGEKVNRPGARGWSASLSPDGRYLFFMSAKRREGGAARLVGATIRDLLAMAAEPGNGAAAIYWVDASFIAGLRPR
jgi:hypothetical protein